MQAYRFARCAAGIMMLITVSTAFAQPDSLWSRTLGGSLDDVCNSVQQTTDGGYIIAGWTESFGVGSKDFWLVKTDADGDSLWSRTFGGAGYEECNSMQQTSDGGFILGGYTTSLGAGMSDFWLVKTNGNGDSLWSRTFGGSGDDLCSSVQQTSDNGYILGGWTYSFGTGDADFWIVKTDANGDSLWSRTFGGSNDELCSSAEQTLDGGYILAGTTRSFGAGLNDFWLVKTDANGNELWNRTFGDWYEDGCISVRQTSDLGFILAGYAQPWGLGSLQIWMLKTNANGDSLWCGIFGGCTESCSSVQQTLDGGYVFAGLTQYFGAGSGDFWLVRTDHSGEEIWNRTFGGSHYDECSSLQQTSDGGYALAGQTRSFGAGGDDFWLVKTAPELSIEPHANPLPATYTLHQNYPNPFNPSTQIAYELPKSGHVSLRVFDILGREAVTLVDGVQPAGVHSVNFNGSSLASGIYFCQLRAGAFAATRKIVLLK
jgi:hypothetical protein